MIASRSERSTLQASVPSRTPTKPIRTAVLASPSPWWLSSWCSSCWLCLWSSGNSSHTWWPDRGPQTLRDFSSPSVTLCRRVASPSILSFTAPLTPTSDALLDSYCDAGGRGGGGEGGPHLGDDDVRVEWYLAEQNTAPLSQGRIVSRVTLVKGNPHERPNMAWIWLKGLAQAKIIKKSVILFRVLNMTIWCKHVHRLELQIFIIFVLRIHQLG